MVLISIIIAMFISCGVSSAAAPPAGMPADSSAADTEDDRTVRIGEWLVLGPVETYLPAFHNDENEDNDADFLLSFEDMPISGLFPRIGDTHHLPGGGTVSWSSIKADSCRVIFSVPEEKAAIAYLAAYIDVPRWMKVDLEGSATDPFELFIDGNSVLRPSAQNTPISGSATATLKQGKHVMIVKTAYLPGDSSDASWSFDLGIRPADGFDAEPRATLDPAAPIDISGILDVNNISSIDLSPDGELVLINYWRFLPPEGERENWMEIRTAAEGKIVRSIYDSEMSNVKWAPKGHILSYSVSSKKTGSIRILDFDSGTVETVAEGIKDLGGYEWGPEGTYIIYYVDGNEEEDGTGIKRLRGIQDRTTFGRAWTNIYIVSVPGGASRKITTGKKSIYIQDIHPNGKKLLATVGYEDLDTRPFSSSELIIIDLGDMSTELLWKGHWMREASWSPDGKKILVRGGPSTFGEHGTNTEVELIPNDYDEQLYIFDPETKEAEPITAGFDPALKRAVWSSADDNIYLTAEAGSYVKYYRFDPRKKKFREFDFGVDVINRNDTADDRLSMVFSASGADQPERIYYADLKSGRAREIFDPNCRMLRDIRLGKTEDWDFVSERGEKIAGHVYYPPDFDPAGKYPCIVYYYGGTSPVDRSFGGRYPKNLWAAKGYVVYVPQPSGATGFGQRFSAAHVNDWGKITADEVIEGTKKFIQAHPFVNPYRVGCIGASYGGFLTQLIITKTDLFAAAVSHAGISMIPSYWGEGYWGYAYNAVSAAESYPWNRPDIYVDQSPLFAADRITTPLLLLHGGSDTNVPPGESEQMYTALKILGREVEYIKYSGQDHFILDYKKRRSWSDAQIAWFDKWLKDQPEWWDDSYPPLKAPGKKEPEKTGMIRVELENGNSFLLGEVTREDIAENLDQWDIEAYSYVPDEETLMKLEEKIHDVEITCVLGTWCPDSKREIPRLWSILDQLGYPVSDIRMLAVGSSRFTIDMPIPAAHFNWSRNIKEFFDVERVATIILSRDGAEIGRIVETPENSLEKDLLEILEKE